jgi:hypothetical protein
LHFDWFFFLCPLVVDHEAAVSVRIEESLVLGNVSEEVKVFDNKVVRLPIEVNLFIASCTALRWSLSHGSLFALSRVNYRLTAGCPSGANFGDGHVGPMPHSVKASMVMVWDNLNPIVALLPSHSLLFKIMCNVKCSKGVILEPAKNELLVQDCHANWWSTRVDSLQKLVWFNTVDSDTTRIVDANEEVVFSPRSACDKTFYLHWHFRFHFKRIPHLKIRWMILEIFYRFKLLVR